MQADDFAFLHRSETNVRAGEYLFTIDQDQLKGALAATGFTVGKTSIYSRCVKVTIFRTRLRLQTFSQLAFTEYCVPLAAPSPSIPAEREHDLAIAFVFDHTVLYWIAKTFPPGVQAINPQCCLRGVPKGCRPIGPRP